ncbi:cell wall-binding repeat-containing protein [Fictibacillus nanhaiensis]|uniref:Cell wall-binding repeat-containing protein n=1 Tax=Fictibacillus nanhaiensis TaxID=742169 RepID=A0ABS2ZQB0_9BACL|nr:cell wall-binding repeat-containing protein [Fictibacillus nanhaiensis]
MLRLFLPFIAAFTLFLLVPEQASASSTRLSGSDRFEVAVNVSKKGWTSGTSNVVLANYNAFADALSAGPLAYKLNAPVLLTHPKVLTDVTKQEIIRLKNKKVTIIGGTGSVSSSVEKQLKNMGLSVERINGKDRYEVSYNVSKKLSNKGKAIIAYGLNFPDALAISPYASKNEYPILLTNQNAIPNFTKRAIKEKGVQQTIISGGEGSVSALVAQQLPKPTRIGGADRYEVAANVIRELNLSTYNTFLTTGTTFADALTGSVLAAKHNAPVILTRPTSLPDTTKALIQDKVIKQGTILGGEASVSNHITSLFGKSIVLDPGHGGTDPGAIGNGLKEKDVVLDVGLKSKELLKNSGARIVMTRSTDTFITLTNRANMGNNSRADSFISIHANSYPGTKPNGSETYWNDVYNSSESKALATEIQKLLIQKLQTDDRKVKEADFYVIKYVKIPSVLVELGFISNPQDAQKLASPTYRRLAAEAIAQGTINFYK